MMKWFSLFFVLNLSVLGQKNEYYKNIHQNELAIRTSISGNIFSLDSNKLKYLPNSKNELSIGVSHPKLPFEISLGYAFPINKDNPNHPRTKKLDFQLHSYRKKYVFDIFYQKYKGFYSNADLPLSEVNYPNLSMLMLSVHGQYVFNSDEFSYPAGFGKKKKQLKTAGSFLAGAQAYYFKLKSDKVIFKNEKNTTLKLIGLNGGYALNHPFSKNWITNLSCNIGLNFTEKLDIKYSALARISLFHIREKVTWGIYGVVNNLHLENTTEESSSQLNFGKVSIDFIYHFKLRKKK